MYVCRGFSAVVVGDDDTFTAYFLGAGIEQSTAHIAYTYKSELVHDVFPYLTFPFPRMMYL